MDQRINFLDAAKLAVKKYYPDCICAFVAGSVVRGEDTPKSDIDIIVLYPDDFNETCRNSIVDGGWPIDFFVHTKKSLDYFFEQDRKNGACGLMTMILHGIVIPEETRAAKELKGIAAQLIQAGPPILTPEEIGNRFYCLTDRLDDIDIGRTKLENYGTLARLYHELGDFYLRSHQQWSGQGKAFSRILRKNNPVLAQDYESAFEKAYAGEFNELIGLTNRIRKDNGSFYWSKHKPDAPDDWKSLDHGEKI